MSDKKLRDKQLHALKAYLKSFSRRAIECKDDAIRLDALLEDSSESLAHLINAQTSAALVSFHVMMKSELVRILGDAISKSGEEVIKSFMDTNRKVEVIKDESGS